MNASVRFADTDGWDCYRVAKSRADEVRRRRHLWLALAALEALNSYSLDYWGTSVAELVREEGEGEAEIAGNEGEAFCEYFGEFD